MQQLLRRAWQRRGYASTGYMSQWERELAERRRLWDEALERRQAQQAEAAAEWARMRAAWAEAPKARRQRPQHSSRFTWWWESRDAPGGGRSATPEQAAEWEVRSRVLRRTLFIR